MTTATQRGISAIPETMKAERRWLLWRSVNRDGKPTKVPYQVGGQAASSTNPAHWSDFTTAHRAWTESDGAYAGVGFVLGDGWAGVDLDDCYDPGSGEIKPWAEEVIERLDSYAEVSPSGRGFKVFCRGTFSGSGRRLEQAGGGRIEVYCHGRYFTVTGDRQEWMPTDVADCGDVLHAVTTPSRFDECRRALADLPDSVSGDGGHNAMLRAACEVRRWGLDEDESWRLLHWFNDNKCLERISELGFAS
jgi:primase-polymerase (primpol)-like protein